jgi:hypothetical protein
MRVEVHIDHYRSKVELNDDDDDDDGGDNDDDDDIRQYRLVINFNDKTKIMRHSTFNVCRGWQMLGPC